MTIPKPPRRERKPRKRIARPSWPKRARIGRSRGIERTRRDGSDAKAIALWSKIVRLLHPVCQDCQQRPSKEAHHLIPRGYGRYRFDETNGAALCWKCHKDVTEDGHENRLLAIRLLGIEEWEERNVMKHVPCKLDAGSAVIALTARLAELKGA